VGDSKVRYELTVFESFATKRICLRPATIIELARKDLFYRAQFARPIRLYRRVFYSGKGSVSVRNANFIHSFTTHPWEKRDKAQGLKTYQCETKN